MLDKKTRPLTRADPERLAAEHSLASLHTASSGLDAAEALRRRAEYGPNRVEEMAREHLLLRQKY
jgi:hypothetical protein